MSALQLGAVVGLLLGGAAWSTAQALRRAPRSLALARERMYGAPLGTSTAAMQHQDGWRRSLAQGAAGTWVTGRFGSGLEMVDLSVTDVVTRVVASSAIVGFSAAAGVVALTAAGLLPWSPMWLALVPVVAVLAGWIALHDVASRIERRRRELRVAANDFVQLVAVGLTTDQSVEEAIRFALGIGGGDAFDALRQCVATAPQRGMPVWEALEEFGRHFDVREMCEFAASVERQGMQGVSIGETVATLAAAMRAKALDQLEREADKANANLSGPTIGFVVTTIVFLAYPLAQRISEAFGG